MKLLPDLTLPDKSLAFFNLTVTDNVYSRYAAGVHLAFNVFATGFASDPDIYISKVSILEILRFL